ncbi:hypothetical protein [Alteromonas halophila]|uniref:Uncharacterized protein n=1 Tax=Alteromonas halophila TaxID=516698 RepID=A0A918MWA3_9ALTE|nr:hypothetical protein [Alteromonas halophila]GGW77107.1 hypothetical protein GCM10007391_07540 [Alteromonas halophila]
MSIIKTLEQLGQNPGMSPETLSVQQREEIQRLKDSALFINASMNISDPDEPDDSPDPDKNPDR